MFDGLVICAGMRRAASTWQYHIARDLAQRQGGQAWGFVTWQALGDKLAVWDGSPTVLKSHVYYPKHTPVLDGFIKSGRVKVLYSYRDLRQVAASMLRMAEIMGMVYPDMLAELDVILESGAAWMAFPDVLVQPYEHIISKPVQSIRAIANWLDVPLSSEEVRQIKKRYTRKCQRERQPHTGYDENNLLWEGHISKRKYSGLSYEMEQAIEAHYGDWLRARGYL